VLNRSIVFLELCNATFARSREKAREAKDVSAVAIKNNFQTAYFLPLILAKLSPNVTPETEPIITYSFSMFTLGLVVLLCFINIVGYIVALYLIQSYDVEKKYPSLKRYINYYRTTTKLFLVLEITVAFFAILIIVIGNFFLFTKILFL